MGKIYLIILLLLSSYSAFGQQSEELKEDKSKYEHPKPLMRALDFIGQRAYPFNRISQEQRLNAIEQEDKLVYKYKYSSAYLQAAQPEWKNIGPFDIGGRVKSVAHHPTIEGTVYIGAAAGGIWKTTDRGQSWRPIFDNENSIAFGSIAIDPANPDILYAATGEASNNVDAYLGSGVYKSTDAGESWFLAGLSHVGAFSKIYVHPLNSDLVIAGAGKRNGGVYKSTNAGGSWIKMYDGFVTDLSLHPHLQNEIIIGVSGLGVLLSTDGGNSWEEKNNGLGWESIRRVSVQFSKSNPEVLYALMERGDNRDGAIYRSNDHAGRWFETKAPNIDIFGPNAQGFYDNYILPHPTNQEICFAGGIDLWRTTNGGLTWNNITNGYGGGHVHVDQHHGAFNPMNPNELYIGNDGGMYRSTNMGSHFEDINEGLSITQFYAFAIDNSKQSQNYGGTQDNGTLGNFTNNWGIYVGGDGFSVLVNQQNPDIILGEFPNGRIWKLDLGQNTMNINMSGINPTEGASWHAPLAADPNNEGFVYHGRKHFYISFDFGDEWYKFSEKPVEDYYTSIDAAHGEEFLVYAGTATGEVYTFAGENVDMEEVHTNGLVNRYVSSITASHFEFKTAYITFSGYGTPHVFKTTDAGSSWVNISSNLPDVPCNDIVIHPDDPHTLFVATDIGVYASYDDGGTWFPYGKNLTRSPVVDLEFHLDRVILPQLTLRAATHGRSIWEVEIPSETVISPEITNPAGGEILVGGLEQLISWYGFNGPVKVEISFDDGQTWQMINESAEGSRLNWEIANVNTHLARIKVNDENTTLITNTFTIQQRKKGSLLQTSNVSHVPYGITLDSEGFIWTTNFRNNKLIKIHPNDFSIVKQIDLPVDSLLTDLAIDNENGIFYIHQLNSTNPSSDGILLKVDANGNVLDEFTSPAGKYPIGVALVDGSLVLGERDGARELYYVNPDNGSVIRKVKNPCQANLGPRGLCYDGERYIYQVCTEFPGNVLSNAYIIKMDKNDPAKELERINLENLNGIINARGIQYDPSDKNFWISDFGGGLYKIAGFETTLSIEEPDIAIQNSIGLEAYPNPASGMINISFITDKLKHIRIELYDLYGRKAALIGDKNFSGETLISFDTGALPSGHYYLNVYEGRSLINSKRILILK
ncbi:MAG: T9SS type A sorting domain-containing protein [Candidatus Kapaibacterium sp.]